MKHTVLFLITSIAMFAFACYRSGNQTPSERKQATGVITYVYGDRVTRHGHRDFGYRVSFSPSDTIQPITVDGKLSLREYKKGDTLTVFFDPNDLTKAVTDQ